MERFSFKNINSFNTDLSIFKDIITGSADELVRVFPAVEEKFEKMKKIISHGGATKILFKSKRMYYIR